MRVHIFDQWLYNLDPGIASRTKKNKTFPKCGGVVSIKQKKPNSKNQTNFYAKKPVYAENPNREHFWPEIKWPSKRESLCLVGKTNSIPLRNYQWHGKCQNPADKSIVVSFWLEEAGEIFVFFLSIICRLQWSLSWLTSHYIKLNMVSLKMRFMFEINYKYFILQS